MKYFQPAEFVEAGMVKCREITSPANRTRVITLGNTSFSHFPQVLGFAGDGVYSLYSVMT